MIYRKLGGTDVLVSSVGMGTMGLGGYFQRDPSDRAAAVKVLREGINLGLNLIDTAEVYGEGLSEEIVGEAVRGVRDRVTIATKFSPENSTFDGVLCAAERSLRRLATDYIDLYQMHWPNPRIPITETMGALQKLVESGKVRFVGLSNFTAREAQEAESAIPHMRIVSNQHEYNLFERTVEERIIPHCRENHQTLLAYSPLSQGRFLTEDGRGGVLREVASRYGMSEAQVVLSWVIRHPQVVAIPKTCQSEHLRDIAAAADRHIHEQDLRLISDTFIPDITYIPTEDIEVAVSSQRNVYRTLEEAIDNRLGHSPSPKELAQQITGGDVLKPIKLRHSPPGSKTPYLLVEGRIRYWAWVIAHCGKGKIPAVIAK